MVVYTPKALSAESLPCSREANSLGSIHLKLQAWDKVKWPKQHLTLDAPPYPKSGSKTPTRGPGPSGWILFLLIEKARANAPRNFGKKAVKCD